MKLIDLLDLSMCSISEKAHRVRQQSRFVRNSWSLPASFMSSIMSFRRKKKMKKKIENS